MTVGYISKLTSNPLDSFAAPLVRPLTSEREAELLAKVEQLTADLAAMTDRKDHFVQCAIANGEAAIEIADQRDAFCQELTKAASVFGCGLLEVAGYAEAAAQLVDEDSQCHQKLNAIKAVLDGHLA